MDETAALPELCQECHKGSYSTIVKACNFCQDMRMPEAILCGLLRESIVEGESLMCDAFRPMLSVVGSEPIQAPPSNHERQAIKRKWFAAFSTQQLKSNPNQVYANLKYHLCFITYNREKLFLKESLGKILDFIVPIELPLENTQANLLWLAEDHIHLYVESTPDYSLEEIADSLMENLHHKFVVALPELQDRMFLWELEYFAEGIG